MRITNKMLAGNFLRDMRTNLNNMKTLQSQLTSGKEIRRPSDDPFKVARSMQLHTDINVNKQYNENIKDTLNFLDTTDTALNQAGNVLHRVRELLVSAGNPGYGESERNAIKDEINEKIGEFSQIMNTSFDGKYIFGGTKTSSKPTEIFVNDTDPNKKYSQIKFIDREGNALTQADGKPIPDIVVTPPATQPAKPDMKAQFDNIGSTLKTEISQGVDVEYNVSATDVFTFRDKNNPGVDKNLMAVFDNIMTNFNNNNVAGLTGDNLNDITASMDNVLKIRSKVGALQNRMESAKEKNENENFNMTDILSKTEDIDITEKVMEFSTMQTVYTASLQTSAKVIQPSLLDYLR